MEFRICMYGFVLFSFLLAGSIVVANSNVVAFTCVDNCGDGNCAEIVCLDPDCPCAESSTSCPEDCDADKKCVSEDQEICLTCTPGGSTECCDGLVKIVPPSVFSDSCDRIDVLLSGGPSFVCTNCGNGVCRGLENQCNCPEDCDDRDVIPDGCIRWYDGCNTCSVVDGKMDICTIMACEVMGEEKCLEYKDGRDVIPDGCIRWYDGCNECGVSNDADSLDSCTERMCLRHEEPRCLEYNDFVYIEPESSEPVDILDYIVDARNSYFCSGCELGDKCYPFGYRKSGEFCFDEVLGFVVQLEAESVCENDFECSSNVCVSGKCVSASLIDKIFGWFARLFGD